MRSAGLAALSGVLYFLGFIGFGYWPLVFLFPAVLLAALEGRTVRQAFLLGALAGFVGMCGGYYWLVHLLQAFAGLSLPLALLGYALLNAYQGALWGLAAALCAYGRRSGLPTVLALPAAVALAEWAYPLLFPSVVAASFLEVPQLMQLADIGGAYLVDAWVAFVGSALFEAVAAFRRSDPKRLGQHLAGLAVSLVFVAGYGTWRLAQVDAQVATARRLEVALIQANLGAAEKTTRRQEFLLRHQEMSRAAISAHPQTQLVVWPEAAFNRAIPREMKDVGQFITVGIDRPVLSGAITVLRTEDERFVYNSAILTSSTGQVRGVYDKVELLAFGETIPFVDRFPSLKKLFPYTGTFDRGKILRHFQLEDGTKLLPMICYEDLLPSLVRRLWRADGPAEVLVNVTNDSWYGDTHEPGIHLALATLRSIETRRALIRSTNTGISAIVDPGGRVVAHTGQWTQEILPASVPLIEDGSTTIYLRVGDWPAWLSLFGFLGLWGWRRYGAGRRA